MAAKTYLVASPEGAAYTNAEEGSEVSLELSDSDELALLAAGWLEEPAKPTKPKGEK
jgi:hypothetical protein